MEARIEKLEKQVEKLAGICRLAFNPLDMFTKKELLAIKEHLSSIANGDEK